MRLFGGVVDVWQGRDTDTPATGFEDNLDLIYDNPGSSTRRFRCYWDNLRMKHVDTLLPEEVTVGAARLNTLAGTI